MKKGQAAMEFLMTYGWAIIVVLVAIGALAYFGVLSPNKLLPERTTFAAPLANIDNAKIDSVSNTVEIAFKNNKGVGITFPNPLTGTTAGTSCGDNAAPTISIDKVVGTSRVTIDPADPNLNNVQNGATFIVTWTCTNGPGQIGDKFTAELSFNWLNEETQQEFGHSGTVNGKYS